jgi:transposase
MPNSGMKRIPDRLEVTGATCCFLDPMRVRIITDTWNKTDRRIK